VSHRDVHPRIAALAAELGIDAVPALVGWERQGTRSYPEINGVVVGAEHEQTLVPPACEGACEGAGDGEAEGLALGDAVGDTLGACEGDALGACEGACEGAGDGEAEGLALGDAVGDTLGACEGDALGACEGACEGAGSGLTPSVYHETNIREGVALQQLVDGRRDLVGSRGRWKGPCLQTTPDADHDDAIPVGVPT
jgi:hypothetical protein